MECRHTASNTHKISLGNPKRVSFFSACFSYAYFFYQVILSLGNRKRSPCATIKKERGLAAPVSWKSPKFWRTDRLFRKASFFENSMRLKGGSCCFEYTTLGKTGLLFRKFKWPNGYGTKTNDNGCSNVIASLYGRDNFTSYLARAANEEKILYIDSEKYEQMEKELPRYGGTRFPPALATLSMDIIIPSSYISHIHFLL